MLQKYSSYSTFKGLFRQWLAENHIEIHWLQASMTAPGFISSKEVLDDMRWSLNEFITPSRNMEIPFLPEWSSSKDMSA